MSSNTYLTCIDDASLDEEIPLNFATPDQDRVRLGESLRSSNALVIY